MPAKISTISLTEEQFESFRQVLLVGCSINEIFVDLISMLTDAYDGYGQEFNLTVKYINDILTI